MLSASRRVLSVILVPSRCVASMVRTWSLNVEMGSWSIRRIRLLFRVATAPAAARDEGEDQQKRDEVTHLVECS